MIPAIPAAGFFGSGPNLNADTPFVFKSTADGGTLTGLNNGDFLTGDVVVHSPNDGSSLFLIWTAPTAGTVTFFESNYWYAHSSVSRSNNIGLIYGATNVGIVNETSSTNLSSRSEYGQTSNDVDTHFNAGDIIALYILKSSGQDFGSLTGVRMTVDFTADVPVGETPIPGALPLFATGLAGLG